MPERIVAASETLRAGDALVVVDVQRDFLPGGALAVPGGDAVLPALNRCLASFADSGLPVFATRDWHPRRHCSFLASGGPWPCHCVQGTSGARFADGLALPRDVHIVSKGTQPKREAYSAFSGTQFDGLLRSLGVVRLFVGGLATEFCVRETVCDALALGYQVGLLTDATWALDQQPGDGTRATAEMIVLGAIGVESGRLVDEPCHAAR